MLKIKDSVDLKELEKFGFEKITQYQKDDFENDNNCWDEEEILYITYLGAGGRRGQSYYLYIKKDRKLYVNTTNPDGSGCETLIYDTLLDLIQAGLVEKVVI